MYILGQPERIGHVAIELFFLRSIFPLRLFHIDIIYHSCKEMNPHVLAKFSKGMTLFEIDDIQLRAVGVCHLGVIEEKNRRYAFLDAVHLFSLLVDLGMHERFDFFTLDEQEKEVGLQLKKKLQIDEDAPVVTLHVRESHAPELNYHFFRNATIEPYYPLIEQLLSEGYVVVRVGDKSMKPIAMTHKNLIDAPFHQHYTTLIEPYFIAISQIFVCTASGPASIAHAYKTPSLYVNCAVSAQTFTHEHDLYVYKKYYSQQTGAELSYEQIALSSLPQYAKCQQYADSGIRLIENTSEEIVAAFQEHRQRLNGTYVETQAINQRFAEINQIAHIIRQKKLVYDQEKYYGHHLTKPNLSHEFVKMNPSFLYY